jgi:hypothetical protein
MTSLQINTPELQQILCAELGGDHVALPSEVRIIDVLTCVRLVDLL